MKIDNARRTARPQDGMEGARSRVHTKPNLLIARDAQGLRLLKSARAEIDDTGGAALPQERVISAEGRAANAKPDLLAAGDSGTIGDEKTPAGVEVYRGEESKTSMVAAVRIPR
jgi:hypothetical protein